MAKASSKTPAEKTAQEQEVSKRTRTLQSFTVAYKGKDGKEATIDGLQGTAEVRGVFKTLAHLGYDTGSMVARVIAPKSIGFDSIMNLATKGKEDE